jgi:hypothetical protein
MTDQPPPADDTAKLRLRFRRMVLVELIAGAVALLSLIAYFALRLDAGLYLFIASLIGGFAGQVWFVAGMAGKPNADGAAKRAGQD